MCEHREWLDNAIRNNQIIKYDYNTFNEIRLIGHGSFGRVSSAISSKFKGEVALKSVKINQDFTIELLVNELRQHLRIGSHNNILEFYGIIEDEPGIFILVLEYANNGTLKEYLCKNFCVLNWDDKLDLARQLVDAIKFLHSHDIIHRDLLSDFGNSKFIADPSIQLTKAIGAIRYSDPQFLRNYSNYKKPIHGTPKDYVKIYEECWKSMPDQRPNIEEITSNFANINIDNVISIEDEIDDKPDMTSVLKGLANRNGINIQGLANGVNLQELTNESDLQGLANGVNLRELINGNDLQGLTNGVDADSEIFHELYEVLSSSSSSASNINKSSSLASNINGDLSDIDKEPITKIDSKTLEYIDNNIKDSDKQFLKQLVQLFLNYINISEEPKLLVNQINTLIKDYDKNPDKIFKILLKHQGQPTFAYLIGFFYDHGIGVKVNKQKASKMYEQAKTYRKIYTMCSKEELPKSLSDVSNIPKQELQEQPGVQHEMKPQPLVHHLPADDEHLEEYQAAGKLKSKIALITGGDSGIGRSIAALFSLEGCAGIAIVHLPREEKDAQETKQRIEKQSSTQVELISKDVGYEENAIEIIDHVVKKWGRIDVLVNNASEQHVGGNIQDLSAEQLERTFRRASLASLGIRVNAVAPGPIWTPLITASFPPEMMEQFGKETPFGRAGQPSEVAPCYVFLASNDSSYMSGQVLHPNGGTVVNG
ncbi:22813_t:CDS:10 [Cetraspora pellucida]|uniref:22813_t:CDS:1 n=1 Tax=Cetraspora pellucida TaxID=1433469 RepID=A0A9N8ZQY8_9GLOM|nr:22813_t:CDS:10 [Cetraspora pellucida]